MAKKRKTKAKSKPRTSLDPANVEFGKRLADWLDEKKEKQAAFAKRAELDEGALSRILSGKRNMSIAKAAKLLKTWDMSLRTFYTGVQPGPLEKHFQEEFDLLRRLLTIADDTGLRDYRRDMARLIEEAKERKPTATVA